MGVANLAFHWDVIDENFQSQQASSYAACIHLALH